MKIIWYDPCNLCMCTVDFNFFCVIANNMVVIIVRHCSFQVTDTIQKVVEEYKCKPVEGMLSHQLQQHKIDGEKAIILNPTDAQRYAVTRTH